MCIHNLMYVIDATTSARAGRAHSSERSRNADLGRTHAQPTQMDELTPAGRPSNALPAAAAAGLRRSAHASPPRAARSRQAHERPRARCSAAAAFPDASAELVHDGRRSPRCSPTRATPGCSSTPASSVNTGTLHSQEAGNHYKLFIRPFRGLGDPRIRRCGLVVLPHLNCCTLWSA